MFCITTLFNVEDKSPKIDTLNQTFSTQHKPPTAKLHSRSVNIRAERRKKPQQLGAIIAYQFPLYIDGRLSEMEIADQQCVRRSGIMAM